MVKDSFVFRKDWYLALKNLGDTARLEVYDAIMREVFEDGNSDLSLEANVAMMFITPLIKRDIEKYNLVCERRKLAGSQGGIAKVSKVKQMVANGSKCKQMVASVADNDNDNDIQGTNVPMSKEEDSNESKKKKNLYPDDFESDWNSYGRKGSKKDSYSAWKVLSKDERLKMRCHIPYYQQSNDRQYLKDFERYIKHRTFDSPVYKGSVLLYDPMKNEKPDEYHPQTDDIFQTWNEDRKCLMFNGDLNHLYDGYTDDNRPDGAMVAWGMYSWKWSKQLKKWVEA